MKKPLNLSLEENIKDSLKELAKEKGLSISALVTVFVNAEIEKKNK